MCNSDVSLPCSGGSEPSACPTSDAGGQEVGSPQKVRKGGYRLRRRNGRMIRAQKTVEESRLCGKGRKRKVTWYNRLLGYRLVTVLWSAAYLLSSRTLLFYFSDREWVVRRDDIIAVYVG